MIADEFDGNRSSKGNMTITVDTTGGDHCTVTATGDMTIYEAAADKPLLLDALNNARELRIDLSALNKMDTAGLQLLILLKREALKTKKVMRIVAHSPASLDILDGYNVASYFGDPVVMPSRQ
jgi:anti-sigma B factor antagonist